MSDSPAAGNPAGGIPGQAVEVAAEYLHDDECNDGNTQTCGRWRCGSDPENRFHSLHARHVEYYRARAAAVLGQGAPAIQKAERERLANRAAMVDEVKHELQDAFQFTERDGSSHSYVTRAWVEALLATHAASAGAAECERTIRLAEEVDARFVVPLPDGGWRHFADLLREDGNEPA